MTSNLQGLILAICQYTLKNSKWQLYHDCCLADINHKMHPDLWKVKKKKNVVLELMKYSPCWWISYLFLTFQHLSWALKVPVSRCLLTLLVYWTGISNLSRSYLTDWFLLLNLPSPQKQNNLSCSISQSVQLLSCVWLFATPWTAARQASLSITNTQSLPKPMSIESVIPSNHLILSFPAPPAFNLPQHQGFFKWVSSSHQVAKVLEFQLQYQSFQWRPRTDLL